MQFQSAIDAIDDPVQKYRNNDRVNKFRKNDVDKIISKLKTCPDQEHENINDQTI